MIKLNEIESKYLLRVWALFIIGIAGVGIIPILSFKGQHLQPVNDAAITSLSYGNDNIKMLKKLDSVKLDKKDIEALKEIYFKLR